MVYFPPTVYTLSRFSSSLNTGNLPTRRVAHPEVLFRVALEAPSMSNPFEFPEPRVGATTDAKNRFRILQNILSFSCRILR